MHSIYCINYNTDAFSGRFGVSQVCFYCVQNKLQ